jgi:flagellar basal-body rod protein FlgC
MTMSLFSILETSGSALAAERARAEIVAANLANAETTHTAAGGPFRRKMAVFSGSGSSAFRLLLAGYNRLAGRPAGTVRLVNVVEDSTPPVVRYEPGHPDANASGFVAYPNINPIQEMVDMMGAVRAYQLNASAVTAAKQMIQQSLEILK